MPDRRLYRNIVSYLKNIPGWKTSRRIVIIECDDFGGIRIPSAEVYNNLIKRGLPLTKSRYRFDTLANTQDIEMLFDVLESVKDKFGHNAVMTPVSNMANPDFEKIRQSGYQEYYYEKFTDTLEKYGYGKSVFELWKQGIAAGIFIPELHGREHISVQLWLEKLRAGNKDLLMAFDAGMVSVPVSGISPIAVEFRPEFYFDSEEQKPFLKRSIKEGVELFREIFGFNPRVFVPSNGIFHRDFEPGLTDSGLRFLYMLKPVNFSMDKSKIKYVTSGSKGPGGLSYYARNCVFEPSDTGYKGIDYTLLQIKSAFAWGKPANISTHRVNFVGGINPENRDKGLRELGKLLKAIVKKWPEVEFMGSGDALEYMRASN